MISNWCVNHELHCYAPYHCHFWFNFDIFLTTSYWPLHVFAAANQNLETVMGRDVKFWNSSFTLMEILKVSTCGCSKPVMSFCSLIGHLKRKPLEVVKNMSKSCQKLIITKLSWVATVGCVVLYGKVKVCIQAKRPIRPALVSSFCIVWSD